MHFRRITSRCLLTLLLALQACATGPQLVNHSFSFNGWSDSWYSGPDSNVQLQEFSYGNQYHMTRKIVDSDEEFLAPRLGIHGPMPVGEFLYVRWRLKNTGEMIKHQVDLRNRLPKDMSDQTLTFVIKHKELYVYLVTNKSKPYGTPPITRTWLSNFSDTYEIYPASHLFN